MIRFAEQRDLPAIYSLWETCFPDEGGFNGYFFSHLYEPQHTLLLMQENTLCAMLQMLPYTLSVNGELREITYIYGVCTHPSHRRRGYAAELLERSFALDKREEQSGFDTHSGGKMAVRVLSSVWLCRDILSLAPLTDAEQQGSANCRAVSATRTSHRSTHSTKPRARRFISRAAVKNGAGRSQCSMRSVSAFTAGLTEPHSPLMLSAGRIPRRKPSDLLQTGKGDC